jgi:hypothetical protein
MIQLPVKVKRIVSETVSNKKLNSKPTESFGSEQTNEFTAVILGEYHVNGNTMYLGQDLKTKKTVRFSPDEIDEILVQVSSHVITNARNG